MHDHTSGEVFDYTDKRGSNTPRSWILSLNVASLAIVRGRGNKGNEQGQYRDQRTLAKLRLAYVGPTLMSRHPDAKSSPPPFDLKPTLPVAKYSTPTPGQLRVWLRKRQSANFAMERGSSQCHT